MISQSQVQGNSYSFNLFNEGAINSNLLLYGNSNGSSSRFFQNLLLQEHQQYLDLTSVVFTTSLEHYQELIDSSNISTIVYSLSDFTVNPFDTYGEYAGDNDDSRNQAEYQVVSLIKDVIKDNGNNKHWTLEHNIILSYHTQELIRNFKNTPTMLDLYTKIYNEFLEKGNLLTETFENFKKLGALHSETIEALNPFTEKKSEVLIHFETLKKYQIYKELLVILSTFVRISSSSDLFSAETKLPILNEKKVVFIEIPKIYEKSHMTVIALLTQFLTQSKMSTDGSLRVNGKMAIYHDLQYINHSNLLINLLRRCRRYGVGIRINLIDKSSKDFISNFSKHAVVKSEHLNKHHLIDQFFINEEECENILNLQHGDSYLVYENYLLDENWNEKKLREAVDRKSN